MKKRLLMIVTIFCLLLTSCGQYQQENASQEEGPQTATLGETQENRESKKNWVIDEQVLPDADEAIADIISETGTVSTSQWSFLNGAVYRSVYILVNDDSVPNDQYLSLCVQMLKPPYTEWESTLINPTDWVEGEYCELWMAPSIITERGLLVLLEGEQGPYIGIWTDEGTSVSRIEGSFLTRDTYQNNFESWWWGQDGSLFLYGADEYVHMDHQFEIKDRLLREDGFYVNRVVENKYNGEVYLICPTDFSYEETAAGYTINTSGGIQVYTVDGKQVLMKTSDVEGMSSDEMYFISETEGYLYTDYAVFGFSLEDGGFELIYDFLGDKYYHDNLVNIVGGYAKDDGSHTLLVLDRDEGYQIWEMHDESKQTQKMGGQTQDIEKEKQVLEWAVTFAGNYEKEAVNEFNKQSKDYEIVFRLPDEGETYEDFRTGIQAEMAAGSGPDLLSGNTAIDVKSGAKKQFLADLTEEFAGYETDILPSAWKIGLVDGSRYAVPYSCMITTVVTDKRLVNDYGHWTLEEAMACMEKSDARYFMAGAEETNLFFDLGLLTETNEQLVDWQNRTAHLDSETAVSLLEFVYKYADHESTSENVYKQVAEGTAMTAKLALMNPNDMRVAAAMFKNQEAYIGFPVENGESGHLIQGSCLAVNQKSPYAEGAVEFIKFLLSDEMQADRAEKIVKSYLFEFPVKRSAMEQVYEYLQEDTDMQAALNNASGLEYQVLPLSDESIIKLRELFETSKPMEYGAAELFEIVGEEISGYGMSGKSAQQVLDAANNRAQLYLDESQN